MKRKGLLNLAVGLACASAITSAAAYDEPPINLGFTSFLDGIPPAGPGFYFEDYLQYYTTDKLTDNNGNQLPLSKTDADVTTNLFQFLYMSPQKLWDKAYWGMNVILPVVLQADMDDGLNNAVLQWNTGVGDVTAGPFLQFDPVMGPQGPTFSQRIELDFFIPTGQYNPNDAINPGSNFWSFNPYWSGTIWFTPKWTASVRVNYLWNAKNTNPNVSFGPTTTSTQAGQAAFANWATEYQLTNKLRMGLNGYFLNQTTDTKANDVAVPDRRERVWAIGPGLLYSFSKEDSIFANVNFEEDARNRPQGTSYLLRYVHHFGGH